MHLTGSPEINVFTYTIPNFEFGQLRGSGTAVEIVEDFEFFLSIATGGPLPVDIRGGGYFLAGSDVRLTGDGLVVTFAYSEG